MKILPPMRQWLPALIRSRVGGSLVAAFSLLVIGITALALIRPIDSPPRGDDGNEAATAAYTADTQGCTELVLDRADHLLVAGNCVAQPLNAGPTIRGDRALPRTDMPPRSNRLNEADRAIAAPEKLRTSVWDVGVTPNKGESTSSETALGGPSPTPPN
jgi:hypothetical protein